MMGHTATRTFDDPPRLYARVVDAAAGSPCTLHASRCPPEERVPVVFCPGPYGGARRAYPYGFRVDDPEEARAAANFRELYGQGPALAAAAELRTPA
jgi:hypothetical protein